MKRSGRLFSAGIINHTLDKLVCIVTINGLSFRLKIGVDPPSAENARLAIDVLSGVVRVARFRARRFALKILGIISPVVNARSGEMCFGCCKQSGSGGEGGAPEFSALVDQRQQ